MVYAVIEGLRQWVLSVEYLTLKWHSFQLENSEVSAYVLLLITLTALFCHLSWQCCVFVVWKLCWTLGIFTVVTELFFEIYSKLKAAFRNLPNIYIIQQGRNTIRKRMIVLI